MDILIAQMHAFFVCGLQDKSGITTLIQAAHKGLIDIVKLLVATGKVSEGYH